MSGSSGGWTEFIRSFVNAFLRAAGKSSGKTSAQPRPSAPARQGSGAGERGFEESPGQYGPGATRDLTSAELAGVSPSYAPQVDGDPDPGEIVWTWVPYVENDGRGKDRPVLIIARLDHESTVGCYLSTKEHRGFVSIGSGPWDSQGRESFISPERFLRVTHDGMRREGTVLPRERFEPAVRAVLNAHRGGNS
ncbi:type II toxin-antitoxin system PemK/MazF family toxin [Leucobacter chromiireducens]|uniref:type II toxin-antitoxin system PemK/MazF family toxin n=1 Tax=Leucobacter chromiireducens TaxID=283877 RepID=UPI001F14BBCE|nr:type II toxin-antitoxin system PemK/MazF family toxin [Leucobacter chromiireducens]